MRSHACVLTKSVQMQVSFAEKLEPGQSKEGGHARGSMTPPPRTHTNTTDNIAVVLPYIDVFVGGAAVRETLARCWGGILEFCTPSQRITLLRAATRRSSVYTRRHNTSFIHRTSRHEGFSIFCGTTELHPARYVKVQVAPSTCHFKHVFLISVRRRRPKLG